MGVDNNEKSISLLVMGQIFCNTSEMLELMPIIFYISLVNNIYWLIILIVNKYVHKQYYFMMMYVGDDEHINIIFHFSFSISEKVSKTSRNIETLLYYNLCMLVE